MCARHRTHEEDDRHHHQTGRDDRCGQTDLALGVQDATASGDKYQHERANELREQPAVLKGRILELTARSKLEHPEVPRTRSVVPREGRTRVVGSANHKTQCLTLARAEWVSEPPLSPRGRKAGYDRDASARPNGLPSESRHIAHCVPGWITLPPSAVTCPSAASMSATVK